MTSIFRAAVDPPAIWWSISMEMSREAWGIQAPNLFLDDCAQVVPLSDASCEGMTQTAQVLHRELT